MTFCRLFFSSRRRHTRCALVTGVQTCALPISYRFPTGRCMSGPDLAAGASASRGPDSRFEARLTPVRVALIVWVLVHVAIFVSQWPAIRALQLSDTDDAMRMAQVRDLLAGLGWWDLTQYRVNPADGGVRSEEHTSELQSLMRISYAVFCLKKKNYINNTTA